MQRLWLLLGLLGALIAPAYGQVATGYGITTPVFSQAQAVTVGNTVSELPLTGTGTGSLTIPGNFLVFGRTIYIRAMGFHSAAGNPTIDIKIKLNGSTYLDTTAVTSGNSTNTMWEMRAMLTVYSTGSSGTVFAQGFYNETGGGANLFGMVNTATQTIDTTIPQTLSITAQWGTQAVGNTITMTNLVVDHDT